MRASPNASSAPTSPARAASCSAWSSSARNALGPASGSSFELLIRVANVSAAVRTSSAEVSRCSTGSSASTLVAPPLTAVAKSSIISAAIFQRHIVHQPLVHCREHGGGVGIAAHTEVQGQLESDRLQLSDADVGELGGVRERAHERLEVVGGQ